MTLMARLTAAEQPATNKAASPAIAQEFDGYECLVEGEYFAQDADNRYHKKRYGGLRINVPMIHDGKPVDENRARSMIKKYMLDDHLKKHGPTDYHRFRTIVISQFIPHGKAKNIKSVGAMSRAQLVEYIEAEGYEIEPELYESLPELRTAVDLYEDDPTTFHENQKAILVRKRSELEARKSLRELNPGAGVEAPGPQKLKQPKAKKTKNKLSPQEKTEVAEEINPLDEL